MLIESKLGVGILSSLIISTKMNTSLSTGDMSFPFRWCKLYFWREDHKSLNL